MITLSPTAIEQLQALRTADEPSNLRVYIQPGGCSGFSYGMGLDANPPAKDDVVSEIDGITIVVDPTSAQYLEGAEVDYIDALMGGGFTINNPNAVKTCGCGHSFQTQDGEGTPRSCGA